MGAGDVLEVVVFGNEDLSRTPTVQTSGAISLPLLGEVPVAGLTVAEIKRKLTELLAATTWCNPQVEVKVKEYQSQFVTVLGEVNSPGRKPLRGRTRLVDVLVEAGGFTPRASGEVWSPAPRAASRAAPHAAHAAPGAARSPRRTAGAWRCPLRHGDIVTASPKYYVTVEGEVARPGRYVLEGDLTVSGAISTAGGLTRFGSSGVKVRRVDPQTGSDARSSRWTSRPCATGKQPDPPLLPNDVISVSRRLF